jgi:hypothetical protein
MTAGHYDAPAWKPEFVEQARKLAELGATDSELADFFGVSDRAINRWKSKHQEFGEALKMGKNVPDERVVASLYQRAIGFEWTEQQAVKIKVDKDEEKVEVVDVIRRAAPDTTACIFWLKNRRRAEWRDKVEHEHAGPDGGPIVTEDAALARWIALKLMTATTTPAPAQLAITGDK